MKTLLILCLLATSLAAQTLKEYKVEFKPGSLDEFISITTPEGTVMKNVKVVAATFDKLKIIHDYGAASLPLGEMPGEVKARFNYDKQKALSGNTVKNPVNNSLPLLAPSPEQTTSSSSASSNDPLGDIKRRAAKEWPGDFKMQEYEIKRQTEAAMKLSEIFDKGVPGIPDAALQVIIHKAHEDWKDDYAMLHYEIKTQIESWKKINQTK